MHTINVLAFGSQNFNTSLEELKDYLNFELTTTNDNLENIVIEKYDILLVHENYLSNLTQFKKDFLKKANKLKILATHSLSYSTDIFSNKIFLPIYIKDLKKIIENLIAKDNYNKNSLIKIKNYILDKNTRVLKKNDTTLKVTEKEVIFLEMLYSSKKPLSRDYILKNIWKYSSETDTHTVETHIYRLRQKIKSHFSDADFIKNSKEGYSL